MVDFAKITTTRAFAPLWESAVADGSALSALAFGGQRGKIKDLHLQITSKASMRKS